MSLHLDDETRRALLLFSLAFVLFAGAVAVAAGDWTGTYSHEAAVDERYVETDEPLPGERIEFDSLSSEEREIFLEAVESDDPVWTSDPVGDRFEYPRGTAGAEWYFIDYEGETYRLATKDEERSTAALARGTAFSFVLSALLLLIAGAVLAAGPERYIRPGVAARLEHVAGAVLPLAVTVVLWLTLYPIVFPGIDTVLSSLPVAVPGLVAGVAGYAVAAGLVAVSVAGLLRAVTVSWEVFSGTFLAVALFWPFVYLAVAGTAFASGGARAVAFVGTLSGLAVVGSGYFFGWHLDRR